MMLKQKKNSMILIIGVVAVVLGLLAAVALAQDEEPTPTAPADAVTKPFTFGFGHMGSWGRGAFGDRDNFQARLAEELGVTVEELDAARAAAFEATLAEAVEAGQLTQQQADHMLAMQALRAYIDPQAIMAEALGITVEELEAAQAEGKTFRDLMDELGLDAATVQANALAAYEAAVQRAVADGVITQAQADVILASPHFGMFGHGGRGHGFGGRHSGFGGFGHFGGQGLPRQQSAPTGSGA